MFSMSFLWLPSIPKFTDNIIEKDLAHYMAIQNNKQTDLNFALS